jgi:hypothetical protein
VETGKSVILFTPLLSGLELRHGNGNSMEEVRSVRAENHFGTHLPAPPNLGINAAKLFSQSCRNVSCRAAINPTVAPRISIVVIPDRL